jgi:hypothetical protein
MTTGRYAARLGSAALFVGTALLLASTWMHPLDADPADAPAAFAEYAGDDFWG